MEDASSGLAQVLNSAAFDDPHFPVYANVNAEPVLKAGRAKELLLQQLANPVRWTDEISAIGQRFPQALFVEMGPGNVLVGLVKKIVAGARTATCGTVAEVQQLLDQAVVA